MHVISHTSKNLKIVKYNFIILNKIISFCSHLLDVLHEQEKSANTNCGGNDNGTATLKCKIDEKQEDNVTLPIESTKGIIKRWTTEEDLTEGLALQRKTQSLADFTRGDNLISVHN